MNETYRLHEMVDYADDRVSIEKVSLSDYVTTDNLLPNKRGLELAVNLPPQQGNVPSYREKDILVANIRPYLKKIWFSDRVGGCSADVLVFRVKESHDPKFVYYGLFRDDFFTHMMCGSKGSKMPRGDKGQILDFVLPKFRRPYQEQIANVLSALDKKIELNNKINAELEAMAKTIYDYWFVQFDFPDEDGKPYKSSGGKMVYNETLKREIPDGWEDKELGQIEECIITGKTPPKANPDYFNGEVPFITIGDIRGNIFVVDTEETLSSLGAEYQSNKYIQKGSICVTCIASPGLVGIASELSQTNQQINSVECKNEANRFYLLFAIRDFFTASKAKTGNTFANMNKGDFSAIKLTAPIKEVLDDYHLKICPMFEMILKNSLENKKLSELRDWLLPMLMNGQVKVE